ncbi:MAG: DMT family transporter [Acidobacteriota bacterium]
MEDKTRGFLLVLFASVCLSTVPSVVRLGLQHGAEPLQLLAPRMMLGATLLWLWLAATRPHRLRIDRRGLRSTALAGGLNALSLLCFYLGLRRVGASVAILVFSTYPAMLLLMLHLRGESVNRRDLLRLALALGGVALVADPGRAVDPIGVAYVLGCAALYSAYMLIIHERLVLYPASTSAAWIVTFLAAGSLLMRPLAAPAPPLDATGWGVVLWSGVVGTAITRVSTIEGVRLLGSGQTALLLPVETVMTLTWAALLLGERIDPLQMLGAALVLTSVLLATVFRRRPLVQPTE